MGNKIQHKFNLTPCICFEWGENLGSLGCCLPKIGGIMLDIEIAFGLVVALVKVECKKSYTIALQKMCCCIYI
jgi:hypothetical protein